MDQTVRPLVPCPRDPVDPAVGEPIEQPACSRVQRLEIRALHLRLLVDLVHDDLVVEKRPDLADPEAACELQPADQRPVLGPWMLASRISLASVFTSWSFGSQSTTPIAASPSTVPGALCPLFRTPPSVFRR
jgi:hypothetical protein